MNKIKILAAHMLCIYADLVTRLPEEHAFAFDVTEIQKNIYRCIHDADNDFDNQEVKMLEFYGQSVVKKTFVKTLSYIIIPGQSFTHTLLSTSEQLAEYAIKYVIYIDIPSYQQG